MHNYLESGLKAILGVESTSKCSALSFLMLPLAEVDSFSLLNGFATVLVSNESLPGTLTDFEEADGRYLK